jgi:hypothetical protein
MSTALLSDREVSALLDLIKGSDTVELKLTVPDSDLASTRQSLGLDPLEAQIRQVCSSTLRPGAEPSGLIVRARRRQGGIGDTVVKLRPVYPEQLLKESRSKRPSRGKASTSPVSSRRRQSPHSSTLHP